MRAFAPVPRLAAALAALAASSCAAVHPAPPATAAAPACPWVGSHEPVSTRVTQVLAAMTLDEKIQMVHGARDTVYAGYIPAIPRLCVPALRLHDGPGGVADGLKGVTQLPAPVAIAASWDTALARAYGEVIGAEEAAKGANVNLGPTVNIVRDPRWGRAFEAYGEDPYLAGEIAATEIQGVQSRGVLAQVKHWVAYNQETFRNTPADDVIVDRRTLHEIYMPQFEAAIRQGGASSVMCSYSTINGTWACANGWTQDSVLRGAWGFEGFITSDWGATHSAAASANGGLDMQMPSGTWFDDSLKAAVAAGAVPAARLDEMVGRILREEFRFGLFDRRPSGAPFDTVTDTEHATFARIAAERGVVLLKNASGLLPLAGSVHSIAVIGDGGGKGAMSGGGGSAAVVAPYVVTPFDAITERAVSGVAVRYARGALPPNGPLPAVAPQYLAPASGGGHGLSGEFFNNMTLSGPPVATRTDSMLGFNWRDLSPAPGVPADKWSARWRGTLTAPVTGLYTLSITSDDGSRLFLNGKLRIDNWRDQAPITMADTVTLTAGQAVPIEVDFYQSGGGDSLGLGWQMPGQASLIDEAVALARTSDVAVVFASDFETEGEDLRDIDLPGTQNALVAAVAAVNPRTIVVLNTGSAVTMPWVDAVPAVLEAWYPGQEDGGAIAAVLFGDVNPSGKLPVTFPRSLADVPASTPAQWPGVGGQVRYSEGLLVGYRWYQARSVAPLFPFGFGLSYTTFRIANLRIVPGQYDGRRGDRPATATVDVTNTGTRAGAEVVQAYVGAPAATGEPPWQLKAFRKVQLAPGETAHLTFELGARAFAQWDTGAGRWVLAPGEYGIAVGRSSADLPLRGTVTQHRRLELPDR